MPVRLEPFINNSIFHVFNKTVDRRSIFKDNALCELFLQLLPYYRSSKAKISFSLLDRLEPDLLENLMKKIELKKYFKVDILAYCLMPTHYHLLLRQKIQNGIPKFISDIINSFTRYFNIKNKRLGPIFLPKFKAVMIKTDEQLMHVSRYIHLNPFSDGSIKNLHKLISHQWSSYRNYLRNEKSKIVSPKDILKLFDFDKKRYQRFVESNANYQQTLEKVKYAEKWK